MLEKILESPLDYKEIQPVNSKGDQSWKFTGRTDAEAEASILWPPDVKSRLTREDSDAGKDWGQEEKGTTEDEIVGWHHQLNGYVVVVVQAYPTLCNPMDAARQASLSFTNSRRLFKLMSTESS